MNDYCKINARANSAASKSRSIDFSDLSFSPPLTPKYHAYKVASRQDLPADESFPEEDGAAGERFGVILSRNCSSASQRFRAREHGNVSSTTLQAAVRRAFSMRKPSSVTEGYRRIHDTADGDGDGLGNDDAMSCMYKEAMVPPKKKRGKFLRACKRIFGIS